MVDNIGLHIDGFDTVDVEGADATMMLQKHIISAGQLTDKIDQLRDKIDAGLYDGNSNLGSILNTQLDDKDHPFENVRVSKVEDSK